MPESSGEGVGFLEKKGRYSETSEDSDPDTPRCFPANSPNNISFLSVALQSTPKEKRTMNLALRARSESEEDKGGYALERKKEKDIKSEMTSQEI